MNQSYQSVLAAGVEKKYRALEEAMVGVIDIFSKENNEMIVSTYQMGIVLAGLEIADKDLYD